MRDAVLRPFFSYYGSKWRTVPRYPAPLCREIVEPFAGSAGYSVRHAARAVTLVDSYPPVAGTWRYLIAATPEEIRRLPLIEPGQPVGDLAVCEEARWLIGWWLNKGAEMPRQTLSAWASHVDQRRTASAATQFWGPEIRERVARQVGSIKHWVVVEGGLSVNRFRKHTRAVAALAAALLMLGGCRPAPANDVNRNQPAAGRSCDESCTEEADTITVTAIWLTPTDVPDGVKPAGEVEWSAGGHVQYSGDRPLSKTGAVYRAWYHSWKANKYPRISITADTNVHGGVFCQIKYAQRKSDGTVQVTVVDDVRRGPKADPGSVTCTSDAWLNTHLNHDQ
jgi:hypothetical protein